MSVVQSAPAAARRPKANWPRPQPGPTLAIALLLALLVAVQVGAVPVSLADWLAPLQADGAALPGSAQVLWQIRLPRALMCIAVGAALALSGALMQGLFRNPLADPGLIGVSAGASCAAALTLTVLSGLQVALPPAWRPWVLPVAAFGGALAVCLLLERMATWLLGASIAGLLLAGLAINAVAGSVVGLCTFLATDEQLRNLTFWQLGSMAGAGWGIVGALALALLLATWQARRLARALNALSLGEQVAGHVGIDVAHLRRRCILVVALLCGMAVAWTGLIGFVGLMAPHLVRSWAGADQRRVLPLAMLAGALLMLVADTLGRTVAVPAEVPVGIFTALLGGPFLLLVLRSSGLGRRAAF